MSDTTFLMTTLSTTAYSTHGKGLVPVNAPAVAVRHHSSQTVALGVYVEGVIKSGQRLSLSLDPFALERKLAVQQVRRELQGSPSALTTTHSR
jgi:hypothetical protein